MDTGKSGAKEYDDYCFFFGTGLALMNYNKYHNPWISQKSGAKV